MKNMSLRIVLSNILLQVVISIKMDRKEILVGHTQDMLFKEHAWQNGTKFYTGSDFALLVYLARAMHLTIRLKRSVDDAWGTKLPNGTWNGVIGMIERKEIDLAIGLITITSQRSEVCEFSLPYFEEQLGLLSKKPKVLPKYLAILWPFQLSLWAFLGLSTIVAPLGLYIIISRLSHEKGFGLLTCYFTSIKPLLIQAYSKWPTQWVPRLVLTLWAFYAFLMCSAYSGSLISSLTLPVTSSPIDSFADLAKSDNHLVVFRTNTSLAWKHIKDSPMADMKQIYRKAQSQALKHGKLFNEWKPSSGKDYILHVVEKYDEFALALDKNLADIRRKVQYTTDEGQTFLHVSKEGAYPSGFGIPMRKDFEHKEDVNRWITTALEFGLYTKWVNDMIWIEKSLKKKTDPIKAENQSQFIKEEIAKLGTNTEKAPFSLSHLNGAFILLLIGYCVAIIAFITERHIFQKHQAG